MLSKKSKRFNIKDYRILFADFDGVFTDNTVLVSQNGTEYVKCSRADGLAFDYLNNIGFPVYVISSEKNTVVEARANKLKIECRQNLGNKVTEIRSIISELSYDPKQVIYVGNDINDLGALNFCGLSFCPLDSHKIIKQASTVILNTLGGQGVFREILEEWFNLDLTDMYMRELSNEHKNNSWNRYKS